MSFRNIMPLIILAAIMVLGAAFLPLVLGTVEAGQSANLSADYTNQLNSTDDLNVVTISAVKFVAPILGIIIIIIAVGIFSGKKRRF